MKKLILFIIFFIYYLYTNAQPFGSEYLVSDQSINGLSDIICVDLDGDSDLDIVAIPRTDKKVVWYENLGGGNYGKQKLISSSIVMYPRALAVSDIDGDGDNDIIMSSDNNFRIVWYENLGGGVFALDQIVSSSTDDARSIFSTDLDGDGDIDILSASVPDDEIAWHENLGSGTFASPQIINSNVDYPNTVYAKDLDNDGDPDVLCTSQSDDKITWYENLGGGNFGIQQVLTTTDDFPIDVYSNDIDGDGDNDILYTAFNDNKVAWFENLGGGNIDTVEHIISITNNNVYSVLTGDIDNDGDLDVFTSSGRGYNWFENLGNGIIDTSKNTITTNGGKLLQLKDINQDGYNDIVHASYYGEQIAWHQNLGNNTFGTIQIVAMSTNEPTFVQVADLDGDGDNDIISNANRSGNIVWFENLGSKYSSQQIIGNNLSNIQSVYAKDMDNDGDIDIIACSSDEDKVVWHENLGGAIFGSENIISSSTKEVSSIHIIDIDGDGDNDIVSASWVDDEIAWHENLGGGIIDTVKQLISSSAKTNQVQSADIDNDGDLDILSGSVYELMWFENLGSGIIDTNQQIISPYVNSDAFYPLDIDSDNDMDIINEDGGHIVWFENLGGIIDTNYQILVLGATATSFHAADIGSDGDMDIIATTSFNNEVFWCENMGGGVFGNEQIITNNAKNARYAMGSDIDGDGDIDIVSASYDDDEVAIYENYLFSPKVKGIVFYDYNQNAIIDSNEYGLSTIQTTIQPSPGYSFSDSLGNYFYATASGSYTISYIPKPLWGLSTDSTSYSVHLTGSNTLIDSLNFGFYPDTILTYVKPELTESFSRCNNTDNYWVSIHNEGTTIPRGTIHLQLDDSITYVSAAIPPDSINGQNIYWHYDSLFFFSSEVINLQVLMPDFNNMGDTLTSYLTVNELDSLGSGSIIYSNTDTLKQILVCAYDPNDKSVSPTGWGTEGFISQNQELEYLIRFQNTGNDTAITVMVRDQLDENLNWSSLQLIASSHPMQAWIEQDGEAVFKFQNIMLPDSGVDFLGSEGFVKFSVEPDSGLAPITPIYNTSNIYFDYNPAVVTNTVLNTIECYSALLPSITFTWPYLYAHPSGNYAYQWYLNGSLIINATADTLLPTVNGNYTVEISYSNSCNNISLPYTHTSVGIAENESIHSVVYPNPFNESTTILFDKNLSGEFDLVVSNILGAVVKRKNNITSNKVEIHKNDVGKGMFLAYLINNQTGEKIFIEKLVVQ